MNEQEREIILGLPIGAKYEDKTVTRELKEEAWASWKTRSAALREIMDAPIGSKVGGEQVTQGIKEWAIAELQGKTSAGVYVMNADNFKVEGNEMWVALPLRNDSPGSKSVEGFLCKIFGPAGSDLIEALPSSVKSAALVHNSAKDLDYLQFSLSSGELMEFLNQFFPEEKKPEKPEEEVIVLYPVNVVLVRVGKDQPANEKEYFDSVMNKVLGDRVLNIDQWTFIGYAKPITPEEASTLFRKMVVEGKTSYLGYENERHQTQGPDGNPVVVLLYSMHKPPENA